ncbi:hypothetical protein BGX28_004083 [Mortierella sp. GBA30]|nr:hypothetical protein BGX28_004083 [Mortierella sp. GBA30]
MPHGMLTYSLGLLVASSLILHTASAQSSSAAVRPPRTTDITTVAPNPPGTTTTSEALIPTIAPTSAAAITTTTTTTTVRTFSDNVITIDVPTTTKHSHSSRSPASTGVPYGTIVDNDKNGGIMLTVSLAVVFGVLAALGVVVFCLFRRRSAKRRMNLFGKNNSDDVLGAIGQSRKGGGIDEATEELSPVILQEMSEQDRQSALLSRRSSNLNISQGDPTGNRMLSSSRTGSAYWNGSAIDPRGGSASNSIVIGSGEYVAGPLESSDEFRNSQYDERNSYYGLPGHSRPLYPGAGGGPSSYNSNDQLLLHQQHTIQHGSSFSSAELSRRSSLSPGLYPQPEPLHVPSPLFRAKTVHAGSLAGSSTEDLPGPEQLSVPPQMLGMNPESHPRPRSMPMLNNPQPYHARNMNASMGGQGYQNENLSFPDRPHSMMPVSQINQASSNLVIPPSITTRPRSQMIVYNMYPGQHQAPAAQFQQQQQQQQQPYYEAPYTQHYSNSNNGYFPPPPSQAGVQDTMGNEEQHPYAVAAASVNGKRTGPVVVVAPAANGAISPTRSSSDNVVTTSAPIPVPAPAPDPSAPVLAPASAPDPTPIPALAPMTSENASDNNASTST